MKTLLKRSAKLTLASIAAMKLGDTLYQYRQQNMKLWMQRQDPAFADQAKKKEEENAIDRYLQDDLVA
jgi:hypothetical protein